MGDLHKQSIQSNESEVVNQKIAQNYINDLFKNVEVIDEAPSDDAIERKRSTEVFAQNYVQDLYSNAMMSQNAGVM